MANATVYLADDVERQVRNSAKAAKLSVSKWIADQLAQKGRGRLVPGFLPIAGAFPDLPDGAQLCHGYGDDLSKESLD